MLEAEAMPLSRPVPLLRGLLRTCAVLAINLYLPLVTLLETALGILISPLLYVIWRGVTRWPRGRIIRRLVHLYGTVWRVLAAPFVRVTCEGLRYQAAARPCVIVVNHASLFDIFLMSVLPDFDLVIYLRAWPFRLGWYAPFMRWAEYQDIESEPWETIESHTQGFVERGLSILVFPEGHRSRTGRLGRFYTGAFRLACHQGIPVVPVCIRGSGTLLPPGRRWLAPARIHVTCLPPVDSAAFTGDLAPLRLRKHVKHLMESHLAPDTLPG